MDYRDNRQRWTESHQVVHFYAGQWCTFTPALTADPLCLAPLACSRELRLDGAFRDVVDQTPLRQSIEDCVFSILKHFHYKPVGTAERESLHYGCLHFSCRISLGHRNCEVESARSAVGHNFVENASPELRTKSRNSFGSIVSQKRWSKASASSQSRKMDLIVLVRHQGPHAREEIRAA